MSHGPQIQSQEGWRLKQRRVFSQEVVLKHKHLPHPPAFTGRDREGLWGLALNLGAVVPTAPSMSSLVRGCRVAHVIFSSPCAPYYNVSCILVSAESRGFVPGATSGGLNLWAWLGPDVRDMQARRPAHGRRARAAQERLGKVLLKYVSKALPCNCFIGYNGQRLTETGSSWWLEGSQGAVGIRTCF